MDPVVIEHLGRGHPLDWHIGDFLTYPSNAAASRQTIRAYRGDLLQFAAHHDGEIGELTTGRYSSCARCSAGWRTKTRSLAGGVPDTLGDAHARAHPRRTGW
jgi:hypothetical protein